MAPKPRCPWSVLVLFLVMALGLAGCVRTMDFTPRAVAPDPAFFFAGPVPTYGQQVSSGQRNRLAYLRALRRVDPCDLLSRAALSKVGEIGSVGTMFAFGECDVDIKVPGDSARRYISVEVELGTLDRAACQYVAPLPLAHLPGAPPLSGPVQPMVRISPITDQACAFADQVGRSAAPILDPNRPPIRDGVAAYPVALAERDPCEILPALPGARWDVGATRPHRCAVTLADGTALRLTLQPQLFEPDSDDRSRQSREGIDVFVDPQFCAASVFVGAPMRRRLLGGDYQRPSDVVIRPSVMVESVPPRCDTVGDIAVAAGKIFG